MVNQRILITGVRGTLGQDLIDRLNLYDHFQVFGTSREILDFIWAKDMIISVLEDIRPNIIINTAAFTNVDSAEYKIRLASRVNTVGPEILAQWAVQANSYLIHISTDYVFNGKKGEPYTPEDIPDPINHYGLSKFMGEQLVRQNAPDHSVILRTSWLFGKGAKNFVPFVMRATKVNSAIQVATDLRGTPTWTGNLCKMILETIEHRLTGIHHATGIGNATRYDQAVYLCQKLGVNPHFITPVTHQELKYTAKRPLDTTMTSSFESAMEWHTATDKYLETQGLYQTHV